MLARVFSLSMQLNTLPLRLLHMNQDMMFNSAGMHLIILFTVIITIVMYFFTNRLIANPIFFL